MTLEAPPSSVSYGLVAGRVVCQCRGAPPSTLHRAPALKFLKYFPKFTANRSLPRRGRWRSRGRIVALAWRNRGGDARAVSSGVPGTAAPRGIGRLARSSLPLPAGSSPRAAPGRTRPGAARRGRLGGPAPKRRAGKTRRLQSFHSRARSFNQGLRQLPGPVSIGPSAPSAGGDAGARRGPHPWAHGPSPERRSGGATRARHRFHIGNRLVPRRGA